MIRTLMQNGGRRPKNAKASGGRKNAQPEDDIDDDDDEEESGEAKGAVSNHICVDMRTVRSCLWDSS
jgi:hypothetical protein